MKSPAVQSTTSSNNFPGISPTYKNSSCLKLEADAVSLSSAGSSGGPAPLPSSDEPPPLVAPVLVVANICTNLASMTGAIMCWYFAAHTHVWGTGFFEGAANIGASMAVLGVLLCKTLPNCAKVTFSLTVFFLGLFANIAVIIRTSSNLNMDITEHTPSAGSVKDLILKILGHVLTIIGAATSSLCLVLLAIKGVTGALRIHEDPDLEFGSSAFGYHIPSSVAKLRQSLSQHSSNKDATLTPRQRLYKQREPRRSISVENAVLEHEAPPEAPLKAHPMSSGQLTTQRPQMQILDLEISRLTTKSHDRDSPDSVELAYFAKQKVEGDDNSEPPITMKRDKVQFESERQKLLAPPVPDYLVNENSLARAGGDPTIVSGDEAILEGFSKQRTRTNSVQRYLKKQASTSSNRSNPAATEQTQT